MPLIETQTDRSACFMHIRFTDGTHKALTGQDATFTGGDSRTGIDSEGTSYDVARGMPRFRCGDGTPRIYLDEADSEVLSYAWEVPYAQAFALYLKFVDRGKTTIAHVGDDAAGTPSLSVTKVAGGYRVTHNNGSTSVQSEVTVAVTAGEEVELRVEFDADGSVRIHASVEGGSETSATASSSNTPAAWSASEIHLAGIGTDAIEFEVLKAYPDDEATLTLLREIV